jgi:hypothetical protein
VVNRRAAKSGAARRKISPAMMVMAGVSRLKSALSKGEQDGICTGHGVERWSSFRVSGVGNGALH